jgi:DNA polymerase-3 subunit epsilon
VAAAEVSLDDVAFCVLDVETTGLQPPTDRVVELAVLRCDAHGAVVDEWHTLVHPQRPMDGESIHGISAEMIAGAPTFGELAHRLLASLDGAVLAAHNADFDRRFIEAELAIAGYELRLPYLCTMHMRRHVGLAAPVMHRLPWACWHAAAPIGQGHAAVGDARAVAELLGAYLREARKLGHQTLQPLAMTAAAANACRQPPILVEGQLAGGRRLVPRAIPAPTAAPLGGCSRDALASYRAAVADAVEDFVLDGYEVDELHELVIQLGLSRRSRRLTTTSCGPGWRSISTTTSCRGRSTNSCGSSPGCWLSMGAGSRNWSQKSGRATRR